MTSMVAARVGDLMSSCVQSGRIVIATVRAPGSNVAVVVVVVVGSGAAGAGAGREKPTVCADGGEGDAMTKRLIKSSCEIMSRGSANLWPLCKT